MITRQPHTLIESRKALRGSGRKEKAAKRSAGHLSAGNPALKCEYVLRGKFGLGLHLRTLTRARVPTMSTLSLSLTYPPLSVNEMLSRQSGRKSGNEGERGVRKVDVGRCPCLSGAVSPFSLRSLFRAPPVLSRFSLCRWFVGEAEGGILISV